MKTQKERNVHLQAKREGDGVWAFTYLWEKETYLSVFADKQCFRVDVENAFEKYGLTVKAEEDGDVKLELFTEKETIPIEKNSSILGVFHLGDFSVFSYFGLNYNTLDVSLFSDGEETVATKQLSLSYCSVYRSCIVDGDATVLQKLVECALRQTKP